VGELETLAREVADLVGAGAAAGLPAVGVAHLTATLHLALDTATAAATVLTGCGARLTPVFTTSHVATCPGGPPARPAAVDMAALDGSLRTRGRKVLHVGRAHRSVTAG
jgi:hypothetical protein